MKIFIIGPSGSGKTTLAKRLSNILNLEHTDLDNIFWDNQENSFGIKRDISARNQLFEKVISNKSWIVEGAYLSWPSKGFELADKLIFLDINNNVLSYRIIKRFFKRKLGIVINNKNETFGNLLNLLKWNKAQVLKMKENFDSKEYHNLIRFSKKQEIDLFIDELSSKLSKM